jgi:hypothetical protein
MEKAIENQVAEVDKIMKTVDGSVDASVDSSVEETVEEVVERPYELRKLKDGDLIPLLTLFRKLGLKEFKDAFMQMAEGRSVNEVGKVVFLEIADIMISKLEGQTGEDIYNFYSDLSGIPVDEIKQKEFGTLPLMIYDSFDEMKNTAFFKVLFKLL